MIDKTNFLKVPGKWLNACGMGDKDRVFRVLEVVETRIGHMVTVEREGRRPWIVHLEARGAEFVQSGEDGFKVVPLTSDDEAILERVGHLQVFGQRDKMNRKLKDHSYWSDACDATAMSELVSTAYTGGPGSMQASYSPAGLDESEETGDAIF
jgi:hypothetical protein